MEFLRDLDLAYPDGVSEPSNRVYKWTWIQRILAKFLRDPDLAHPGGVPLLETILAR